MGARTAAECDIFREPIGCEMTHHLDAAAVAHDAELGGQGRSILAYVIGVLIVCSYVGAAAAGPVRGVVVDQTGLALPGATVEVRDGPTIVTTVTTGADGSFTFDAPSAGLTVSVMLSGFETVTVAAGGTLHVVLPLAGASEQVDVSAPMLPIASSSPTAARLGTSLTAATMARLPAARQRARTTLPLLPSVVRGPDGLLRLGGARPHEAPLWIDGFDVTDPATGTSALDLPLEAVRAVEVLRDPMAVTYGGLLGAAAAIETTTGGDTFKAGLQGFIPRPRFSSRGFGRIEGIFPRVYVSGRRGKALRYVGSAEYDFERIPVPDVTTSSGGPNIGEIATTLFGRVDIDVSPRHNITAEGLFSPRRTSRRGLSPLRPEQAAPDLSGRDLFAGLTDRHVLGPASTLTLKVGALTHDTTLAPRGQGPAVWAPAGWRNNSFSALNSRASRVAASATWERAAVTRRGVHDVTAVTSAEWRGLDGSVAENPVRIEDAAARLVRTVDVGPAARLAAADHAFAAALRDVWQPSARVQVDAGSRLDWSSLGGAAAPSARAGVRYEIDRTGATVVKAGVGSFVGSIPLAVPAFGGFPTRVDRAVDVATGVPTDAVVLRPSVGALALPRAVAATLQIERHLASGLDGLLGVTARSSSRLPTLDVPASTGALTVASVGRSTYRELQVAVRRTWSHDNQVFVSYVRSSARGDLNDFGTVFSSIDAPLVQPDDVARLAADAPNRWLAWGTISLPHQVVISPTAEWHSGFPYSTVDARRRYAGPPNGSSFPAFFTLDLIAYKTVTVDRLPLNLGVQLFNATNHFNPRDVVSVVGAPQFGTFTNSVGPVLRGYMLVQW